MKNFAFGELKLKKDVRKCDKESLLSLFDAEERFKRMMVMTDAPEDSLVRVMIGDLTQIDLKLGADMKQQKQKTIMTLFWYSERAKKFEIQTDASSGQNIDIRMILL